MLWRTPRLLIQIGEILEHQSCYMLKMWKLPLPLMTPFFFCTDATKAMKFRVIQVVGGFAQIWGRFSWTFSIINLCQIGKKSTPSCVFFSQMMTQRIATKSSINARKSHQRVKSAMKCPLTGGPKKVPKLHGFWGEENSKVCWCGKSDNFTWEFKEMFVGT